MSYNRGRANLFRVAVRYPHYPVESRNWLRMAPWSTYVLRPSRDSLYWSMGVPHHTNRTGCGSLGRVQWDGQLL